MKAIWQKVLAVLVVGAVLTKPTFAKTCDSLYVVGSNHAAPISYTVADSGEPMGLAYDLFREVSVELKVPVQFLTGIAWTRANAWLDSNEIDVLLGVYDTPDRREKWVFSTAFLMEGTGFYQLDNRFTALKKYEDLQGLRGGAIRASSFGKEIDSVVGELQIFKTTGEYELFKMLLSNRLDYVVAAHWDATHIITNLKAEHRVSPIPALTRSNSVHLAMNKTGKCAWLMDDINTVIEELLEKNQINIWLRQHLSASSGEEHARH